MFKRDAWARQVGGQHYKKYKIQPAKFLEDNRIGWLMANVIKYASRVDFYAETRPGKAGQDLEKIIHYAQLKMEEIGHATMSKVHIPKRQVETDGQQSLGPSVEMPNVSE